MSQRKPGSPPNAPENSSVPPGSTEKGASRRDTYEWAKEGTDPRAKVPSAETAAPEVSRGAWRERAFVPRGTMPREQILAELERGLKLATMAPAERAVTTLKAAWAPILRQAVEQGGGDGLDAQLRKMLKLSGPAGLDPLVRELCASMQKLNSVQQALALVNEAKAMIESVARATDPESATRISLKVLEKQLEGRIDVDALLEILFADDAELVERLEHVERTIETLRGQLRGMPGTQPDGMFSNFARLKVEKKIIEAEQARRGSRT